MRKFGFLHLVVLCLAQVVSLSAREDKLEADAKFFKVEVSKDEGTSSAPPPISFLNELSTFLPQIPKVNVITGEYCEEECDLIIAGIEPLSYRRFYEHTGHKDEAYGHWRINPESLFLFNFDYFKTNKQKFHKFAGIGDENGSFLRYERNHGNQCTLDTSKVKNFTNAPFLSGQQHPLNTRISFNRKAKIYKKHKDPLMCWYDGVVENGDGRKRFFTTDEKMYPSSERPAATIGYLPPFQGYLTEERRPNGNIIRYDYIDFNEGRTKRPYYILKSVTAYNSRKTKVLGSFDIYYARSRKSRNVEQIRVHGSDGRQAVLYHRVREVQRKKKVREWGKSYTRPKIVDIVLNHVVAPSKPIQKYNYRWEQPDSYFDHPYMFSAAQPEDCVLTTAYDLNSKKVTKQSAPIGPNGEMLTIARYLYRKDHTTVYDGENQKTIYRFNNDKRITAVEKYEEDQLIQVECSEWNASNGNLIRKQIEDGSGNILCVNEYEYDKNHNVIEEKIGDGKSADTIRRTFSDDGFNLKLTESDRPGKQVCYSYIPGTNLLSTEFTYAQNRIVKRIFHFYDDEITSVRVKTIIDDGRSENPFDLTQVTNRKILEFQSKREAPCVGLPEEIQEKTFNVHGNEILLKKVYYTYHPSGKIEKEDHYDAKDTYRYSIINEYDEKERLIATTDALGSRTTFAYDANFNLISQDGPRQDARKEWSYDKVNRPIQERESQTDGTTLLSEKKYDKCSRLISQTDPCGFETCYEYNALGMLTTVIYPDGSIEKKEYDALGNVIKEIDANGHVTCRAYNFRNQPTAIFHPDGREEHFTYNIDGGTLATHTDPNGTKTAYSYDLFDNLVKTEVYSPEGKLLATTSATFSPFHKLSETDAEGITTHYSYDFAGRMVTKQVGKQMTSYVYDELGYLTHTREGDIITTNIFDVKGQLLEKKIKDVSGETYFQETYSYDANGNRTSVTTCAGVWQTGYNSRGTPIRKIDPLGNTTDIAYTYGDRFTKTTTNPKGIQTLEIHNARGRLVDLQFKRPSGEMIQRREKKYDPSGNQTHSIESVFEGPILRETITHEWIYGPGGRIEKVIEAGEKTTQHLYDKAGKVKTIIKPDGSEIHHEYDALGRLSRLYGTGIDYAYIYDRKDRLLEVKDKIHKTTTNRVYDIYDNVIEERLASGLTIRSHYDPYGRRTAFNLPDDSGVTYIYQGPYLHSVSRKGYTHTYSERNLAGQPTLMTLPNKSGTISITWDPLLRWEKLHSLHYQASCDYDSVGNLIEYSYTDPLGSEKNLYTYDDLNQLISENGHDYRYDSLYNRTAKNDSTYSLNSLCQITHDGQTEYTHDLNGNLISDGTSTYEYDLLDRLISVTKDKTRTTYTYDAFNRRIAKNDELYIWDGKNEIGMSQGGKICELRVLGEGLGAEIGSSVILEIDGRTYFPVHDIQGSLVTMLHKNGKAYRTYRYTAFGEQLTKDRSSPWRFASKRYDEETHFIYFGRRYYSPNLGRWITADPHGFDDGPNLYAYVHNSPFITLDLHGLFSWRNTWLGMKNFGTGMSKHTWGMVAGAGRSFVSTSEWLGADALYEMGERSHFHAKSSASYESWKSFGSALYHDPFGTGGEMLVPGLMEAFRNPRSAESWGKATLDIALIGITAAKLGQTGRFAIAGRMGDKASAFGKAGKAAGEAVATERFFVANKGVTVDLDALSKAASVTDRGALTVAGRSLAKHGSGARPGNSLFPTAKGNPQAINFQATTIIEDILTTPNSVIQHRFRGRFGPTIEISAPDGRGIVYDTNGSFLFFKE